MNADQIRAVTQELRSALTGRFFGKIFQLRPLSIAFDFGLRGEFLYVSVEPASPRLYLIRRRTRDLEKQSHPLGPFGQVLRSTLQRRARLPGDREPHQLRLHEETDKGGAAVEDAEDGEDVDP